MLTKFLYFLVATMRRYTYVYSMYSIIIKTRHNIHIYNCDVIYLKVFFIEIVVMNERTFYIHIQIFP